MSNLAAGIVHHELILSGKVKGQGTGSQSVKHIEGLKAIEFHL